MKIITKNYIKNYIFCVKNILPLDVNLITKAIIIIGTEKTSSPIIAIIISKNMHMKNERRAETEEKTET